MHLIKLILVQDSTAGGASGHSNIKFPLIFFWKFFVQEYCILSLIKLNIVQNLTVGGGSSNSNKKFSLQLSKIKIGTKIIGNFCIREVALSSLVYEYILSCFFSKWHLIEWVINLIMSKWIISRQVAQDLRSDAHESV